MQRRAVGNASMRSGPMSSPQTVHAGQLPERSVAATDESASRSAVAWRSSAILTERARTRWSRPWVVLIIGGGELGALDDRPDGLSKSLKLVFASITLDHDDPRQPIDVTGPHVFDDGALLGIAESSAYALDLGSCARACTADTARTPASAHASPAPSRCRMCHRRWYGLAAPADGAGPDASPC